MYNALRDLVTVEGYWSINLNLLILIRSRENIWQSRGFSKMCMAVYLD